MSLKKSVESWETDLIFRKQECGSVERGHADRDYIAICRTCQTKSAERADPHSLLLSSTFALQINLFLGMEGMDDE
jgi:hypothetical protein